MQRLWALEAFSFATTIHYFPVTSLPYPQFPWQWHTLYSESFHCGLSSTIDNVAETEHLWQLKYRSKSRNTLIIQKKVIHVKNVSLPTNSSTLVSLVCYINLYYFTFQHFTIQIDLHYRKYAVLLLLTQWLVFFSALHIQNLGCWPNLMWLANRPPSVQGWISI